MKKYFFAIVILFLYDSATTWHDKTHIAVGTVANFDQAYNLAAPDVAKLKANVVEEYNHWYNCPEKTEITTKLVKSQIQKYNVGTEKEKSGHLYGAIVGAVRAYQDELGGGKYADYHLVYAGHYIGDLSMPLHNMEYNLFNSSRHVINDAIVENEVSQNLDKIKLSSITINNEDDLIQNIVIIATKSKDLAYKLQKEDRNMTKEEAYQQLSLSASLFKAVLEWVGYYNRADKKIPTKQ